MTKQTATADRVNAVMAGLVDDAGAMRADIENSIAEGSLVDFLRAGQREYLTLAVAAEHALKWTQRVENGDDPVTIASDMAPDLTYTIMSAGMTLGGTRLADARKVAEVEGAVRALRTIKELLGADAQELLSAI